MVKNTPNARVPKEILEDLDRALGKRFDNKLISRKELSYPEGFRLIRRMPEWNLSLNKLGTLPKKEDLTNVNKKKR